MFAIQYIAEREFNTTAAISKMIKTFYPKKVKERDEINSEEIKEIAK